MPSSSAAALKPYAAQDLAWLDAHRARAFEHIAAALADNAAGECSAADVCQVGFDEVERVERLRGAVALRDLPDGAAYRLLPGQRRSTRHVMEVVSSRGEDKTYVRWIGSRDDIGSSMNITGAPSEHDGTLVDLISLQGVDRQAALDLGDRLDAMRPGDIAALAAGGRLRVARLDADTWEVRQSGAAHGVRLPRSGTVHRVLSS